MTLFLPLSLLWGDISAIYLSWYDDPATTMTIQWHTPLDGSLALQMNGKTYPDESHLFSTEPILIHTVHLRDLAPDTEYSFQIGKEQYSFKTAPSELSKPLKFAIGGDMFLSTGLFRKMSHVVVEQDPLFAVLGGDLAYAINNPSLFAASPEKQWRKFLAEWTKTMKTESGRLIPFLLVPGNHDLSVKRNDLFFSLFAFPEKKLYRAIDFASTIRLVLLDTGHLTPVAGPQTEWLSKTLAERAEIPHLFAVYHVGAYPSFYSYESRGARNVRDHWCPLFDQYAVQAAFEHHSHAYKKTYPIKANQKDPLGTIYFGDGCWGVKPRKPHNAWYLEQAAAKNHVYLVEVTAQSATIRAIDAYGKLLEKTVISSRETSPPDLALQEESGSNLPSQDMQSSPCNQGP